MQILMFLFWCAVGRLISGDNGEGSYEANLAAGIRGTSSADSEPTAKEFRNMPEIRISHDGDWKKRESTTGPLQSLLDEDVEPMERYLTGHGNGAETINDRHRHDIRAHDLLLSALSLHRQAANASSISDYPSGMPPYETSNETITKDLFEVVGIKAPLVVWIFVGLLLILMPMTLCCLLDWGRQKKGGSTTEEWLAEFYEPRPGIPLLWGWVAMSGLTSIHMYWVSRYTSPDVMKTGDIHTMWVFFGFQLLAIVLSNFACNYLFPRFPTIFGVPFILMGFTLPFHLYAVPFMTDFGKEFSAKIPLWCLTIWGTLARCMIESTIQLHHAFGVKGCSYWLKWPIQTVEETYTMTYPLINYTVTRTKGGNYDAFLAFFVALPIALITFFVDNDENGVIKAINWAVQIWMILYLFAGPFLHFFMGMPGPNNIFDGKCEPKKGCQMHAVNSGTLGIVAYMAGSYAVVHFICFLRKQLKI